MPHGPVVLGVRLLRARVGSRLPRFAIIRDGPREESVIVNELDFIALLDIKDGLE